MPASTEHPSAAILIVDDQQSNVRLLEHILRRGGYVAATSTMDPVEVCALHGRNHYDLIILDLQMPVMDGFEVLKNLRALDASERPAVLVMSADPSQMLTSIEAGAGSFLSKPYVISEVLRQVEALLQKSACKSLAPDPAHAERPAAE